MELKKQHVVLVLDATEKTCGKCQHVTFIPRENIAICSVFRAREVPDREIPYISHGRNHYALPGEICTDGVVLTVVNDGISDDYARCVGCLAADVDKNLDFLNREATCSRLNKLFQDEVETHHPENNDRYAIFRNNGMRIWPNARLHVKGKGWTPQAELQAGDTIIFGTILFIGTEQECAAYDRGY